MPTVSTRLLSSLRKIADLTGLAKTTPSGESVGFPIISELKKFPKRIKQPVSATRMTMRSSIWRSVWHSLRLMALQPQKETRSILPSDTRSHCHSSSADGLLNTLRKFFQFRNYWETN